MAEFLHVCPFQHFTFWSIPELFYFLEKPRTFNLQIISEYIHSGPFTIFFLQFLDHSQFFQFWTIPEFLHSGPFQNFCIPFQRNCNLDCIFFFFLLRTISEIIHFWPFQKLLHSGPLKNVHSTSFQKTVSLDHSRICTFMKLQKIYNMDQNLYIVGHSKMLKTWAIAEFLHSEQFYYFFFLYSEPFQNFYVLDHSGTPKTNPP